MRAVQIIGTLAHEAAGPSYSVRRLAETLAERGITSEVLSLGAPDKTDLGKALLRTFASDYEGVPVLGAALPSKALSRAIVAAAQAGAVLHAHGLWRMPNLYPSWAIARHGVPLLVSPRGMLAAAALAYSPWQKRAFWVLAQRRALQRATCLHATSEAEMADIRTAGFTQPVALIPNGIDVAPSPLAPLAKSRHPTRRSRTVLQLGRLHPIKRIDRLLEAWAGLEAVHPDWHLKIVGPSEGGHQAELEAQAARHGLARVSFAPAVFGSAKDDMLRQADLLVLASESENFGMVVAEALGNGTPVITTKGTPWAGLVEHACGWWIDHGVTPLAKALGEAMVMPRATLDDMGARGRAWMLREFSWGRVAADMEAVYRWCQGKGKPPACVSLIEG
jgi:glycosyltransferase involved in cell wall biosynthesis